MGESSRRIEIFGKNQTGINESFIDSGDEMALNEAEKDALAEFEENDKELENLAAQICGALDTLKGTAENIEK